MKESDLYLPVKQFMESQNYEVKGEILDCDVMAVRAEEVPVIVELKLSFNLTVVLQAVERLSLTPKVYIGIPNRPGITSRRRKPVFQLLKMLGLGLIVVDLNSEPEKVEVILDPVEYKPRKSKYRQERLLGEFVRRVGDPNLGGMDKRKGIMTSYRQRAIAIGWFLKENGPTKASHVAQNLSEPKARDIMYKDVYGWFERESTGVYKLSPRGGQELSHWEEKPHTDFPKAKNTLEQTVK